VSRGKRSASNASLNDAARKRACAVTAGPLRLSPFAEDGALRVVVESPRHSTMKIAYDPESGLFSVERELPLGVAYPFDKKFIPGTLAEDGDPIDAMILHPHTSYPGMILRCRILGMIRIEDRKKGKILANPRVIATPSWHQALAPLAEARGLSSSVKSELERFFALATAGTGKTVSVKGWASAREAERTVRRLAT